MGIEKDYLMRQLLMLFEVIQKILMHRKKGEKEEALEEIKHFYRTLKIEEDVEEMGIEDLIQFLESEKKLENRHIELVALVLVEQGELSKNDEARKDYFRKAYFLLEKVEHESTSFSMERQMKIAELKEYID